VLVPDPPKRPGAGKQRSPLHNPGRLGYQQAPHKTGAGFTETQLRNKQQSRSFCELAPGPPALHDADCHAEYSDTIAEYADRATFSIQASITDHSFSRRGLLALADQR